NPATPNSISRYAFFADAVATSGSFAFLSAGIYGFQAVQVCGSGCSGTVSAGGPYTTSGTTCVQLNGRVSDGTLTPTWSTSGSGTFSPNNITLNPRYCPSLADVTAGSVTLTLADGLCPNAQAQLTISSGCSAIVSAGGPYTTIGTTCVQIHGAVSDPNFAT